MVDKSGYKYLLIKYLEQEFIDEKESDWSLVADNSDFAHSNWLCMDDYEVYQPYQIKQKFFKSNSKLTEKKLVNAGYMKIIAKTYEWAYGYFFDLLDIKCLKEKFADADKKELFFWKFIDIIDAREEVYELESWIRLSLAVEWCEKNEINYRIDIPNDYPSKKTEKEIKKKIISKINNFPLSRLIDFLTQS